GVTIAAVTGDGRTVEVFEQPGAQAMAAMFEAARKQGLGNNHYRLAWDRAGAEVEVELRIVSVVQPDGDGIDALGLQLSALVDGSVAPPAGGGSTAEEPPAVRR